MLTVTELSSGVCALIAGAFAVISVIRERRTRLKYSAIADVETATATAKNSLENLLANERDKRESLNRQY
jgi:hypothetical protein